MLKFKKCCITVNKLNLNETYIWQLLIRQQQQQQVLRFQSTTAAPNATNVVNTEATAYKEWQTAKPFADIPTMSIFTLLRNFIPGGKYYKLDSTQLMEALREDMGTIFKLPGFLGSASFVFTHNVHDFEKVLRNEGIWPNRPGSEALHYHRNVHRAEFFQGIEGLIATQGEKWGSFRSVVNPVLMQPKNVKLYLNKMSQVNKEFIERIHQIRDPVTLEVPATFEEEINRWTLESVSVVALDKKLGLITTNRDNPMAKKLFKSLTNFFVYSFEVEFKPSIWRYIKTPTFNKLMETLDTIVAFTSTCVIEAIERLERDRINGVPEKPESEKSVLEKLIKIDQRIATVMAMDMLMAGVDTTSSFFVAFLLCMAQNPEKQKKLREEVMTILPQKNSEFDKNALSNMPYLKACLRETLRFYPLTAANARIPVKNIVLSGYRVPKGTPVSIVSTSLMHNDKHYPRANEYLPERWLRSSKENENTSECPRSLKPSSPFVYLPFGFGARSCIGRRIVEMELQLGIARTLRNFNIEYNYPTDNAFRSLFINVPNIPLKFKLTDVDY